MITILAWGVNVIRDDEFWGMEMKPGWTFYMAIGVVVCSLIATCGMAYFTYKFRDTRFSKAGSV